MRFYGRSLRGLLPILLILVTAAYTAAQDEQNGLNQNNIATLIQLAKSGDAHAQCLVGVMYFTGTRVPKDEAEAVRWYRKAAEQGYAEAQNDLGVAYQDGRGVPKDYAEAVHWYRKAAEQGFAEAQFALGSAFGSGEGVPKDEAEAVRWYRKAAEQGHVAAQARLGLAYDKGQGIPKDVAEAVRWYRKAAERGDKHATLALGLMFYAGEGVPRDYGEAAVWLRKAADQGDPGSQSLLAGLYEDGHGVPQDYSRAAALYREAAEQNDKTAQFFLGKMYYGGRGVQKDYVQAAAWLRKAADQGDPSAQADLGSLYYMGRGIPEDRAEAVRLWRMAADQGDKKAKDLLYGASHDLIGRAISLKVVNANTRPFTTHSGGGSNTNCTFTDSHANCDTYNSDFAWKHIENSMLVEASDGKRYTISCTASFRWSKCASLTAGESFSASVGKDGITVFYRDGKGKEREQLYAILGSEEIPPKPAEALQSAIETTRFAAPGRVSVTSTPSGADISFDGSFAGNTPSTISLTAGKHVVAVSAKGYLEWKRELTINGGSEVSLSAVLESEQ
jgi:TPR repeat protein